MKSYYLKSIFVIIFCFYVGLAYCHSFNKIVTQEGETNLSVRQIMQDRQGLLWLATFSGVYVYNGSDNTVHFNKNSEIDNDVTAIAQDKNGFIWIGTNNGLAKYDPQTEKIVSYSHDKKNPRSISDQKIRCITVDSNGQIWIGTREGGLNLYTPENDSFKSFKIGNGEGYAEYIKCILLAKNGSIWLGTWQNGVYCLSVSNTEIKSVTNYRSEDPSKRLSHNHVYCLFEDANGNIVAGTRNGLNVIDPDEKKVCQYHVSKKLSQGRMTNYIRSIYKDKNEKIWVGTWGGIVICDNFLDLKTEDVELVYHDSKYAHSISNNQIMDIFQDNSGSVWIGTENGLNNYDPYQNQFQYIGGDVINDLQEQTATDFYPYKDGVLIMTLSHGIIFKNEKSNRYFPANNQFAKYGEKLYALLVDSKNNVWAGTYNGMLIRMDGHNQSFSAYRHSANNSPIYVLEESVDGNILVGTRGEGLKLFDPLKNTFKKYAGLPDEVEVNDILIDENEKIWIISQYGIYRQDAKYDVFEHYLPENHMGKTTPNVFTSIVESGNGGIYIGGRNGFYQYDKGLNVFRPIVFGQLDPLWVTNIQVDSKDNLWLNLNFNKIAKVNPELSQIKFFNVNNGIRSSQYNRRGFFIDHTDKLYLSGFDDIYQFNTSSLVVNNYSPAPVFSSLTVNNTELHPGTEINNQVILSKNINHQKEITLNHRNKDFTINFISTSYLNQEANQFRYILHGYDKDWHIGNQKLAHYTNLSAGKYTFEVFSANNDGIWSKNSASLPIRVKPSPLFSKWAIILYIVVLALLIYQIRKVLIIRLRLKNDLLIERVKREKEEKFHQERLRFYTNISHELRTPLTLIMGPIRQLIDYNKNDEERSRLQQLILNNSNRLLNLVNQILDFRKSLYEGMKIKVTYSNIVAITESNLEAFEFMSKEKSIATEFFFEKKVINGWFDREKLDIILFNLLSNAYKYTPEMGTVTVELKVLSSGEALTDQQVEISITNTGKGIDKHLHAKIFERFYQTDGQAKSTGTGIGLSLVKNLVELHHGSVNVDSQLGESTTFTVCLPLTKQPYAEEEIFDLESDLNKQMRQVINYAENQQKDVNTIENKDGKQRIVIVEDNYELREFLYDFLSEEYCVFTANDGLEGLSVCEEHSPHLIISDIMMENMDGLEFCKKIKSNPEISHIPVILMTALASSDIKMDGYKTGADDYITKPFEPQLLKVRIKNLISKLHHLKSDYLHDINITPKELTLSQLDEDLLKKMIELVEVNLDNSDYNNELLCQDLGVSYSYLYRKIKNITGTSPSDFVQTFRLKKAAHMLIKTKYNISEVAFKVGYNDALYFSKCFKKHFGESPSIYIKRQKIKC
ncbi:MULTISPECIES: two-component regulator propeller domain-containing protein [unclassified Saccharicrinis]|uniref:two-component regulator propeller domain-containing protein n=1 Tax=unclassified Saccharicrinis TaxID=2646859 RepID=UPI003D331BC1